MGRLVRRKNERMSTYPVRLNEWFPPEDEHRFGVRMAVAHMRCYSCGSRCNIKKVIGHHSIPWGYGDIWCSEKCLMSGKIARVDFRRLRSQLRRLGRLAGKEK